MIFCPALDLLRPLIVQSVDNLARLQTFGEALQQLKLLSSRQSDWRIFSMLWLKPWESMIGIRHDFVIFDEKNLPVHCLIVSLK